MLVLDKRIIITVAATATTFSKKEKKENKEKKRVKTGAEPLKNHSEQSVVGGSVFRVCLVCCCVVIIERSQSLLINF